MTSSGEIRPELDARLRRTLLQCLVIGFCVALGAHLLLGSLFKSMHRAPKPKVQQGRFTVMVNPAQLSGDDRRELLNALKYGDPTLFAKPDERFGFSAYRDIRQSNAKFPAALPPDKNDRFAELSTGFVDLSVAKNGAAELPPPDRWLHFEQRIAGLETDQMAGLPLPAAAPEDAPPVWLDASFKPLGRVADTNGEIAKLLAANSGKPLCDTVVAVKDAGPDLPPSITVWDSCGVKALDIAAVRSLTLSFERMPRKSMSKGDAFSILLLKWTPSCQLRVRGEGPVK